MKFKFIGLFILGILLLATSVFAVPPTSEQLEFGEGLLFVGSDIPEHHFIIGEDFTYIFRNFQQANGLEVENQTCYFRLIRNHPLVGLIDHQNITITTGTGEIFLNGTTDLNETGKYTMGIICNASILTATAPDVFAQEGGYMQINFNVVEETTFGVWEEPDNWTFPIIFLVLSFIFIMFGLVYTSSIIGVFGSIMLILSYFVIGGTAPLLLAPLLIIGLLLAFKFGSL